MTEDKLYLGDNLEVMPTFDANSIDSIVTDPPYGISFMGKNWDKAVPSIEIWQQCLRVLKPGAFAFVMCIPRQDCLARMICRLEDVGFNVSFSSIYHTFANGFPKAQNLSKIADKRAGDEREIIAIDKVSKARGNKTKFNQYTSITSGNIGINTPEFNAHRGEITAPATPQAKALDGAYGGFQPKPAVEIIIVAMKPLEEKTYVDQAIANGHGCTWFDDCRIPFEGKHDFLKADRYTGKGTDIFNSKGFRGGSLNKDGRFPANVLCEDDVLNDDIERKSGDGNKNSIRTDFKSGVFNIKQSYIAPSIGGDSGSFSRYFSLDAWFAKRIKLLPPEARKTFPWLIVPKASKSEKNKGLLFNAINNSDKYNSKFPCSKADKDSTNKHPTCKPIKLMSWLITLASREGDIVLDPFVGSGTTCIATKALGRHYIGIEREKEYYEISRLRLNESQREIDSY